MSLYQLAGHGRVRLAIFRQTIGLGEYGGSNFTAITPPPPKQGWKFEI